jgi:hypothetical protein
MRVLFSFRIASLKKSRGGQPRQNSYGHKYATFFGEMKIFSFYNGFIMGTGIHILKGYLETLRTETVSVPSQNKKIISGYYHFGISVASCLQKRNESVSLKIV